jgi:hypothetical protein
LAALTLGGIIGSLPHSSRGLPVPGRVNLSLTKSLLQATKSSIIATIDLSAQTAKFQRPIFEIDTVVPSLEFALISKSLKHDNLAIDEHVTAAPEPHMLEPRLVQSGPCESSPKDRRLCCECAKIDLETIFHADPGSIVMKGGVEVANFGRRLEAKSTCYLCRFFWASRLPTTESPCCYTLQAFSLFLGYPGLSGREIPRSIRAKDIIFLAVVPTNFREVGFRSVEGYDSIVSYESAAKDEIVVELCWKYGYIFHALPQSGHGGRRFYGRIVNPLIDFSILRGWLDYCRKNHTDSCSVSSQSSPPGLMLIDCQTRLICNASDTDNYTALGYV